jgi:hypothetical protein
MLLFLATRNERPIDAREESHGDGQPYPPDDKKERSSGVARSWRRVLPAILLSRRLERRQKLKRQG